MNNNSDHLTELLYHNVPIGFYNISYATVYDSLKDPYAKAEHKKYGGNNGWSRYVTISDVGTRIVSQFVLLPTDHLRLMVNIKNSKGELPLYVANKFGSPDAIQLLTDARTNPTANNHINHFETQMFGSIDDV